MALTLLERGTTGGDHLIAGLESLNGDELADRVGAGGGRTNRYHGQPLNVFEREINAEMDAGVGRRLASKCRYFAALPDDADAIRNPIWRNQIGSLPTSRCRNLSPFTSGHVRDQ